MKIEREFKEPYSKEKFKYAKRRMKISHDQLMNAAGINESTYFMDFRKNYQTTSTNLEKVAKVLDVSTSYLNGDCLVSIPEDTMFHSYWKQQNRIDPENNIMFPYDSTVSLHLMSKRTEILTDYIELLGIRGLEDFDTGKMYYFARDQIRSLTTDTFEYRLQRFIFDYLKENHFFENIGYDMKPKGVNLLTNQKSMVVKVIYDQDDNETNNPESEE